MTASFPSNYNHVYLVELNVLRYGLSTHIFLYVRLIICTCILYVHSPGTKSDHIYITWFRQVRLLYKGMLRVLLVLLHDFPEFLCEHHFSFCDVISPSCIQMRNLILSAFPRNMRLPDPFTPNLKVRPRELLIDVVFIWVLYFKRDFGFVIL